MGSKNLAFLILFLLFCANAEAKIFIKPFDSIGVRASGDLTVPCASGAVMKASGGGVWACGTDATGAGSTFTTKENDTSVSAATDTLDFGLGFDATESPSGEINVSMDATEKQSTRTLDGFMRASDKVSLDIVVAASHDAVTLAGSNTYLTLSGQQITRGDVSLGFHTAGNFAAGDAEFGAATSGDTATAFFPAGTIEVARGGTALSSVSNDAVLVGNNGGTGYDQPALPSCSNAATSKLLYDSTNNALFLR